MKAVAFDAVGSPLRLMDAPMPKAGPGELVFRVDACGICASDLHAAETPGFLQSGSVLGHEYTGTVIDAGAETAGWAKGDRLVSIPARPCGECPACLSGDYVKCADIALQGFDPRLPGAYAEFAACMAALAYRVPETLKPEVAALVEPLAVGLGAWKSARAGEGAHALIIGAGIIGLAVAKWARFFGAADVGVAEMVPARIERARAIGAEIVIDAREHPDPVAEYARRTGRPPSVIFECVGRPMIARLIEWAPIDAQLVLVGTGMQMESFTVLSAAMKRLRMTFCLGYEPADFPFVLKMLSNGRLDANGLVSASVPLDEAPAMFATLQKPNDHCKVLIKP